MKSPNFILLYVKDSLASVRFYEKVLGAKALEESANFSMFALDNGTMLGLWSSHDVEPKAESKAGASELGFTETGRADVDACFASWKHLGVEIIQEPTDMDFGYTFAAQDPDGHRLRVFFPS